LKKKKQKNFCPGVCGTAGAPAGSKSFLVLFFKKEHLSYFAFFDLP
jgi:hypothetical protein